MRRGLCSSSILDVSPTADHYLVAYFGLRGADVMHGIVWQLVTYSFLHGGLWHLLLNMLTLWMFGSQEEQDWGSRRFLEYYFFCVVGAALVTVGVSYTGFGMNPHDHDDRRVWWHLWAADRIRHAVRRSRTLHVPDPFPD